MPSIVMLTKLVENDKVRDQKPLGGVGDELSLVPQQEKCSRYWPEASSVEPVSPNVYRIKSALYNSKLVPAPVPTLISVPDQFPSPLPPSMKGYRALVIKELVIRSCLSV